MRGSNKIVYTSLRIIPSEKTSLINKLEEIMKTEEDAYKTNQVSLMTMKFCDHMTTVFLGGVPKEKALSNPIAKQTLDHLGEKVEIKITRIEFNDRIAAAAIDKEDLKSKSILCDNDFPHITICSKKGVKPVESNFLLAHKEGTKLPTIIELKEPILVNCEYSIN